MPSALIRFSLPDEHEEHLYAIHGPRYRDILEDVDRWARDKLKYEDLPEAANTLLEDLRTMLREARYGLP